MKRAGYYDKRKKALDIRRSAPLKERRLPVYIKAYAGSMRSCNKIPFHTHEYAVNCKTILYMAKLAIADKAAAIRRGNPFQFGTKCVWDWLYDLQEEP